MKFDKLLISSLCLLATIALNAQDMNFFDFKVESITGEEIELSQYQGKKILVVNTASKCGLTPQYETLEELYKTYNQKDFVIIGFPANNFGAQEPGTNEEIATFCKANYGVSFPMMGKISVKGDDMHELYQWLTQKAKNGVEDSEVTWNFQKYLIDEKGNYVAMVAPQESPACDEIINFIEQ
jgi:glutathione peroxidase